MEFEVFLTNIRQYATWNKSAPTTKITGRYSDVKFASFQLVWLLNVISETIYQRLQLQGFEKLFDKIHFFDNIEECQNYLKQIQDIRTILVVPEKVEQSFMLFADQMEHISLIFICHQKAENEQKNCEEKVSSI